MPRRDFPRDFRGAWRRDYWPSESKPGEPPDRPDQPDRAARYRPSWWPENEPWPPPRRYWRSGTYRPFFRRLGCLFLLLSLLGAGGIVTLVIAALNSVGFVSVAIHQAKWIVPIAGILLAFMISAVVIAGTNLRRMSVPLDDLLAASRKVAEGDYSVRVAQHGPLEVRSLGAAFNSMAEQLDAHDKQRRSMLADVTHELRTPLTVIQGNIEGMLDGLYALDEAHLRSILEETQVLSRLTDDLRTLSQAESGTLQLRREPTDLGALADETALAFQSQADAGDLHIEVKARGEQQPVNVDPERIRQVLSNLISNAVRYSPRGSSVLVEVGRDANGAALSVSDHGSGIAAADLPHVFDRYYKSADSRGMGLGLSIAKYIVEAHGGQIRAESPEGVGTIFRFTLPG